MQTRQSQRLDVNVVSYYDHLLLIPCSSSYYYYYYHYHIHHDRMIFVLCLMNATNSSCSILGYDVPVHEVAQLAPVFLRFRFYGQDEDSNPNMVLPSLVWELGS